MKKKLERKYHNKDLNIAFNDGINQTKSEIMEIINKDRENGNVEAMLNDKPTKNVFSPALCLSKIIKYCEDDKGQKTESSGYNTGRAGAGIRKRQG